MSLTDTLKEAFLEEFSELNIDNVDNYAKENNKAIIFLCSFNDGFNEKIEKVLGDIIIKNVRENYYPRLFRGRSPESLAYPKYLAYALEKNSFSFDELRRINLENDSWRNNFIKKHLDGNLLKNEREKLLNSS